MVLGVEDRGRLQLGADRKTLAASDAWAVVRQDAWADEFRELQLPVADAGKSVGLVLACPERGDPASDVSVVQTVVRPLLAAVALALEEPGKPGAAPSGARSCADQGQGLAVESVAVQQEAFEPALDCQGLEPDRQELSVPN